MTELVFKTAAEIAGLLASKEISSQEVTKAFYDRAEALNPQTNSYLYQNRDTAMAAAVAADKAQAEGKLLSILHGVPIAVKDNQSKLCRLVMGLHRQDLERYR